MPKRKRSHPSRRNQRRPRRSVNPSAGVQVYRGPSRLPNTISQQHLMTVELVQIQPATSSGGGVISTVISLALSSFNEYTNYSNLFDEWRLLSATCLYKSLSPHTELSTALNNLMVMVVDRDSNAALTTLSSGYQYESAKIFSTNETRSIRYLMSGSEDAQFASVSSTNPGFIKTYSANLSNSTQYGYFLIRGLFQLRGKL